MENRACPLSGYKEKSYNGNESIGIKEVRRIKMIRLEWLFLMQLIMGGLMIVFLRKQMQMKRQLDEMTREVTNYISYITEDVIEESQESVKEDRRIRENYGEKDKKNEIEDAQNRLIQAVLGEYFP